MSGVGREQESTNSQTRCAALMDLVWAYLDKIEFFPSWMTRKNGLIFRRETLKVLIICQAWDFAVSDFQQAISLDLGHHSPILHIAEEIAIGPVWGVFIVVFVVHLVEESKMSG